jgi:uncharacterized protein YceK
MQTRHSLRWRIISFGLAMLFAIVLSLAATTRPAFAHERDGGFNDEYVFATTKAVEDMDVNPALKVTLLPVSIVLDAAFLPFEVIAGFVS